MNTGSKPYISRSRQRMADVQEWKDKLDLASIIGKSVVWAEDDGDELTLRFDNGASICIGAMGDECAQITWGVDRPKSEGTS